MIEMLNKRVHPIVPEKGSLGASGDLAPLSHMVLPMIGLGQAEYMGKVMTGQEAMKLAGIAVIHTIFNILATFVLLPFSGFLEKLAIATIKSNVSTNVISRIR